MDLPADPPSPAARRTAVLVDVGLTAITALLICLAIAVFREPDARPPDAMAYALGITVALPLLVRRRAPLLALFGCYGLLIVYYWSGYPAVGFVLPLAVALTSAAAAGHLAVGSWLVVFGLGTALIYRMTDESEAALSVLDDTLRDLALAAAALLLGELIRSRRQLLVTTRERLRLLGHEREREAADRVEAERLRLARELHDTVAHTITVIGVQADVADELIDEAPEDARRAVRTIRSLTGETLTDLRRTLGALRDGGTATGPVPGIEQIPDLLDRVEASGLAATATIDPDLGPLPASVAATVHRVVQESVTNVLRHASATRVTVQVRRHDDEVEVQVRDDGRGEPVATAGGGHGLAGMRERVVLLGGRLDAGPAPDGGFEVRAVVPSPQPARQPRTVEP